MLLLFHKFAVQLLTGQCTLSARSLSLLDSHGGYDLNLKAFESIMWYKFLKILYTLANFLGKLIDSEV